jgi:lipopolysaccharide transport system ATP-binding protein
MSDIAIRVNSLSKLYHIGVNKSGSLRDALSQRWHQLKGKKIDVSSEEFWALQDVSFDINQGEAVGIIGKNGAGKSTLLKILSRITKPTTGRIEMNGRVASLLEVGTGFHPDLSGRENIFLNGTILGMKRSEIKSKFDQIVDFSEVEKFIDTPVKHYSSGMYVRLAFAVAAHLEPEILIIDEVLAVGDAEFQKKCLGKMGEVTGEGRTVIFVSHNMQAVQSLCTKAILLQKGQVINQGPSSTVINNYLSKIEKNKLFQRWNDMVHAPGNEKVRIKSIEILTQLDNVFSPIDVRTPLTIKFEFWNLLDQTNINLSLHLNSLTGECIFNIGTPVVDLSKGLVVSECHIPGNFLNDGVYSISMMIIKDTSVCLFDLKDAVLFEVEDFRENVAWFGKWLGAVRPQFPFTLKMKENIFV